MSTGTCMHCIDVTHRPWCELSASFCFACWYSDWYFETTFCLGRLLSSLSGSLLLAMLLSVPIEPDFRRTNHRFSTNRHQSGSKPDKGLCGQRLKDPVGVCDTCAVLSLSTICCQFDRPYIILKGPRYIVGGKIMVVLRL